MDDQVSQTDGRTVDDDDDDDGFVKIIIKSVLFRSQYTRRAVS